MRLMNPCKKCLIKMVCSENCQYKIELMISEEKIIDHVSTFGAYCIVSLIIGTCAVLPLLIISRLWIWLNSLIGL